MQPETLKEHGERVDSTLGHLVGYIEPNRDWCAACRQAQDTETDYPTTGHDKTCELWIVETARDSLRALVVEVDRLTAENAGLRHAETSWMATAKSHEVAWRTAEYRVNELEPLVERLTAELEGLKSKLGDGEAVSSGDGPDDGWQQDVWRWRHDRMEERATRSEAALRAHEFVYMPEVSGDGDHCPSCGQTPEQGHHPECRLAAALTALRAEEGREE